jgi:hypothetical protein
MLTPENPYFISKYMVFLFVGQIFPFYPQRKGDQENVRFIVNPDTVLNIIPVDYVAKVVSVFQREDIEQLNIVHRKALTWLTD